MLENARIYIDDEEFIIGNLSPIPRSAPICPEFGIMWLGKPVGGDTLPDLVGLNDGEVSDIICHHGSGNI